MRRLFVAVLLGGSLLARPVAAQTSGPVPEGPTLTTDRPAYARGQVIRVEGEGWPARTLLTVELCGNEAANGSVDCDARNATTGAATADGTLFVDLLASAPPSLCPCVVHVFSPGGAVDLGVRVRIEGVPEGEVTADELPARRLEVTELGLTRSRGLATWFGAAPTGTLRATVANTGEVPVQGAALRVRWGRSVAGTRTIDADDVGPLAPGETVEVEIPVELEPVSFGRYVVSAGVTGFSGSTETTALSTYPVGLILVVMLLATALVALRVWRFWHEDEDEDEAAPVPVLPRPEPAPVAPVVEDAADTGPPLRRVPTPVRAGVLVVVLAVALTGVVRGCADDPAEEDLTPEELCAELREIDPGRSFAGASAERLAAAAVRVSDLEDRVPRSVAGAVSAITTEIDEDPTVLALPRLEQGDEGYTQAYQAAYALRFDGEITVAAALLERYGVDECDMEPSGAFDIDAVRDRDLDPAAVPVLTQDEIEALRVEFSPSDVEGFELEPFEIPEVEFDDDLDGFELEVPEIPRPELGP